MSAEVMHAYPMKMDPAFTGSLFSCSQTKVPCHHFCLKHCKPLEEEVEEWFMTDEEEEEEEEETGMEEGDEEERELTQAGLLDQLLDEAYAHYYDEPDEWDELANWYTTRMNSDESSSAEHQSNQSSQSSGAASSGTPREQAPGDFHPAYRPDPAGITPPGRFARRSEDETETETARQRAASGGPSDCQQRQPPVGTPAERFAEPAGESSSSRGGQRRPRQQQQQRNRDWAELVDEQERNEAMQTSSRRQLRRNSPGWSDATLVSERELYETFNDLFFPDPESGQL